MSNVSRSVESDVEKPRIAVLGMGHVGLPTALGLAELGWEVLGADSNPETIATLKSGRSWFYEPGLEPLLKKHLETGSFTPTEDVDGAVAAAMILFVCVGTPQSENGKADLAQVETVARTVARNLNGYKLIVEKSTVPAVTAHWVKRTITRYARIAARAEGNSQAIPRFDVASSPEFLQEGRAVENFFKPDRVVIGVDSHVARELLESIYRPLNCPLVVTDLTTAELIKHAANAFLSTKISFINMVGDMCEAVGADVANVARGIGLDARIGTSFLNAGIGFGGYCFPKDLRAFAYLGEEHGVDCGLLREVERINQRRIAVFLRKIRKAVWILQGKTIGVLGLAFKPGTDDIREAPALRIVDALLKEGASVRLYDPEAMPNARQLLPEKAERVTYCQTAYDACAGAHALLLLTEWDEFRRLDLRRAHDLMEVPVLVDGRGVFDPATARKAGFEYQAMGRDSVGHHVEAVAEAKPSDSTERLPATGVSLAI